LLLIDDVDKPHYVVDCQELTKVRQLLRDLNKEPVEVIGDYLRCLWSYSLACIQRAVGKSLVESHRFAFVITVPAIWPAYARNRMREAVMLAGMLDKRAAGESSLNFVSEPEAAALATISDMSDRADLQVSYKPHPLHDVPVSNMDD
jgi:molecular chaperone DnaK (HSP70)